MKDNLYYAMTSQNGGHVFTNNFQERTTFYQPSSLTSNHPSMVESGVTVLPRLKISMNWK
jgi:hypothetical protein